MRPARRALRRSSTPPAARTCAGAARSRSTSTSRAGGRAARLPAPAGARRRHRDPHLPPAGVRAGDPLPAPRRGEAAGAPGAERGGRPRPAARSGRAPAEARRRALLLPWRVPARRSARRRLALGPRAPHLELRAGEPRRSAVPGVGRGRGGRHPRESPIAAPTRVAYAKGAETIEGVLAARRRLRRGAGPRGAGRDGRDSRRTRTASPTPTTRTSCARAAPRTPSSGRCARSTLRCPRRPSGAPARGRPPSPPLPDALAPRACRALRPARDEGRRLPPPHQAPEARRDQ